MKISAIILAAGKGRRFKNIKKQFKKLHGKRLIDYSIEKFKENPFFNHILLVVPKEDVAFYSKKYNDIDIVPGGKERCYSVKNALKFIRDSDYICIHDAARPFFSKELLKSLIKNVKKYNAVIPAIPPKDTIKSTHKGFVRETLNRKSLVCVQTPQVFEKGLLIKAYGKKPPKETTDDAYLVEKLKIPVKIIPGEETNIKITTPLDWTMAEMLIKKCL